jgi:hypothetical protein
MFKKAKINLSNALGGLAGFESTFVPTFKAPVFNSGGRLSYFSSYCSTRKLSISRVFPTHAAIATNAPISAIFTGNKVSASTIVR